MMFTAMKLGIFKATGMYVSWLLTDSISVDLEFYRMDSGIYSNRRSATRKIKTHPTGKSGGRTLFSSVMIGDVNGDRRSDLLVQQGQEELRVYLGVPGPHLFARLWPKRV